MRVLFLPLAVPSHSFLMTPLAWAFRAAGHEVRVAAQRKVLAAVSGAGLPVSETGGDSDFQSEAVAFLRQRPQQLHHADGRGAPGAGPAEPWIRTAEACAADLVELGRSWLPDLVVADSMVYAAPLLADVLKVPFVRFSWGPDWPKTGLGMGGRHVDDREPVRWPQRLLDLYRAYGARTEVDTAACTVDPFPPSLQLPGLAGRLTVRPVPYNGSGTVPAWLAEPPRRPRICVTWGTNTTVYMGDHGFRVPAVLAGLAGLDVEIVLALSEADRDRLGTLPPGARVVTGLPLDQLLPTCTALVSQGGAAGLISAAVLGVPQLTVPMMADQPTNAQLLAGTGAGIALEPDRLNAGTVRAAAERLLHSPEPRAAAERLRREIEQLPPPSAVVDRLTALADA
ncbi:nucleotide disphospho-sugar-binding domain-containing protein [Actinoplanes sp. N902-109]|uniref:nucleotide disphospho-sugar-binding domain-containing protein n=1 Tax=Actinoplanes sp. (strain N902-109) TaxID=649831 RepID=UPI0003294228|nr:nucleotide disphospho-sugar-binding domain-containing protein [Actinoplanes sp. N902-109]AGL16727.1 ChlC7 [Actinoplanes sp. N902-109]